MVFKIHPFMRLLLSSSTHPVPYERWVFDQFALPERARILEVGCNSAHLWINNADRIPPDWHVCLTDIDQSLTLEAARVLLKSPRFFSFMNLDVSNIPNNLGQFDAVIANRLFHTFGDDWQGRIYAINETRSRLTDAGIWYSATNGDDDLEDLVAFIKEFDERCQWKDTDAFGYFALENGLLQLQHVFSDVKVVRYPDVLAIKDADLLYRSVMSHSRSCKKYLVGRHAQRFKRFIADRIERDGSIQVRRSTGMFIARP